MNFATTPFFWFLVVLVVVWGSLIAIFWKSIQELSQAASLHARTNPAIYASAMTYVGVEAGLHFIEIFEKLSPDVATVLPWWSWACMFMKPAMAGAMALRAYLDTSAKRPDDPKPAATTP